jgi:hypothetical protein
MNFDAYKNTVMYPDYHAYRAKLIEDIDNTPMTSQERLEARDRVAEITREWFNASVKPHNAREWAIQAEFWKDCQEDIGYNKFLSERQCQVLQGYAWERGHSGGYYEVYNCLLDLAEFAKDFVKP